VFIDLFRNKKLNRNFIQGDSSTKPILLICLFLSFLLFKPFDSLSFSTKKVFVVAKVDNQAITNLDLTERFAVITKMSKIKIDSPQEKRIIINQILQKMIDENLQNKEAKKLGITVDQEKILQIRSEVSQSKNIDPEKLEDFFTAKSIPYESFLRQIESQILWSEIVKKTIAPTIKVSQSEIDELLELRKIKTNIEKYFISELFIPFIYKNKNDSIDSKSLAFKLFNEIEKGKSFNDIVRQFSQSPTAEFDGEIGWIGVGDVDDETYQEIVKTKTGETSRPVLTKDGYYLFKVAKKQSFNTLTKEDKDQVKNIIFSQKLKLMAKSHLMDLRKNSYIEIEKKELKSL
jgi:peptidyl-prolyl cis-trans isomerase SurA